MIRYARVAHLNRSPVLTEVMTGYTTVGSAEVEAKIVGSRFIGIVSGCADRDAVKEILADARIRYPGATHYCYAAIFGNLARSELFSDNGEPAGTAGRPILEVLRDSGLTDVMVVAVRYFGGTLLGTGGLVKAYSETAAEALKAAERINMIKCARYSISLDYASHGPFISKMTKYFAGTPRTEYPTRSGWRQAFPWTKQSFSKKT